MLLVGLALYGDRDPASQLNSLSQNLLIPGSHY